MRPIVHRLFVSLLFLSLPLTASARAGAFMWTDDRTLRVDDGQSVQYYRWADGLLTLLRSHRSASGRLAGSEETSLSAINAEDIYSQAFADRAQPGKARATWYTLTRIPATERCSAGSRLDLYARYDHCEVRRTLCVYDEAWGVEWRLAVKGDVKGLTPPARVGAGSELVEDASLLATHAPHYFCLPLAQAHVTTSIVSFREATDHHSNPVHEFRELPYRKAQYYAGNVLLVGSNGGRREHHLIVKLSPLQRAQAGYAGYDFSTEFSALKVYSPGLVPMDMSERPAGVADSLTAVADWQEAYPLFVLMHADTEDEALAGYRRYELAVHKYLPERDNTFTVNTWGDRNRDSRVNEPFILRELDAAAKLGVTHYQIDDGWQQGLSQNSSRKEGVLWDDWQADDWQVNTTRFPHGLRPVVEKAHSHGIELGLWFNPSKDRDYAAWQRDKQVMLNLHRTHGVSWLKIDGLEMGTKTAERRIYHMLYGAQAESGGLLQFNMDVTAGRRGGFFSFHRLGNTFLENRYTDWGNYYPHLTLRNLWLLARYIPAQRLQIEWLNKWRNPERYLPTDVLRPSAVPFDYQLAITFMAQPLAWFEVTSLPEEAFTVAPLIDKWKRERSLMQSGLIYPVGAMPDGHSFTGFVSAASGRTYVLLFREHTTLQRTLFNLPVALPSSATFVKLGGGGRLGGVAEDRVEVLFDRPFDFLWGYFH